MSATQTPGSQTPGGTDKPEKKARRKTSHLKLVPETPKLREQMRDKCREVAARMNKEMPPTKDELEVIARRTLDEMGQAEGYVGWVMVMISTEFFRDAVAATPPSRRLFLLPHCLKHAEGCPADYDEFGMDCKKCGACSIADFRTKAEEMGYKVLVAEGSPVVLKIIVSGYVDSIVGVACLNVLEKAIDKILLAGIPCMAVPLLSSDCRNTSVDEAWVREMLMVEKPVATQQTRSYVHLMRAASDMFAQPQLDSLVGRQRSQTQIDIESANPLQNIDPIAATEALAANFLARGGKYSRPFITLAAYDAMLGGKSTGADGDRIASSFSHGVKCAAMSIECFHKASLVHDDIEDGDAFRYGVPAMHQQFGLATAINVGDYMIGLGYRLIGREIESMRSDISARLGLEVGEATFGIVGTASRWVIPRLVAELRERSSGIELMVREAASERLIVDVASGVLAQAIVTEPVNDPRVQGETLMEENLVAVLPKSVSVPDKPIALAKVLELGLVLPPRENPLRREVESAALEKSLEVRVTVEVEGIRLIADLVASGAGASIMPETALPSDLPNVKTRAIIGMPPRRLALISGRETSLSSADTAVRAAVLDLVLERKGRPRKRP